MNDKHLVIYLVAFGALGGIFSALGVWLVKSASGGRATNRGRALAGCGIGLAIGMLFGVGSEVVLSKMFKWERDLPTAAAVGIVLGTLAGAGGGTLRGASGGLVAGLLFGNLVVTTQVELLGRIITTIGGVIAGVFVAVATESEDPAESERKPARPTRAEDAGAPTHGAEERELTEVRFECAQCGKRLKARGEDVGRLTKCGKCGWRMRILQSG